MTQPAATRQPGQAGYTLTEILVAIVILSLLASIAIPAYNNQIRKSRRTDARTALLDLASREERFLSTNTAYSSAASDLGYGSFPSAVGSGYYALQAPNVTAPTSTAPAAFTLTALPVTGSGQDADKTCAKFTVDSTGKQVAYDSSSTDTSAICWN